MYLDTDNLTDIPAQRQMEINTASWRQTFAKKMRQIVTDRNRQDKEKKV